MSTLFARSGEFEFSAALGAQGRCLQIAHGGLSLEYTAMEVVRLAATLGTEGPATLPWHNREIKLDTETADGFRDAIRRWRNRETSPL